MRITYYGLGGLPLLMLEALENGERITVTYWPDAHYASYRILPWPEWNMREKLDLLCPKQPRH